MTDAHLVRRVLAGERAAYAEIVRRYTGPVHAVCQSRLRNRADSEDVTQEVFVHAYLRLHTLRDPEALGPWLRQAARRRCTSYVRSNVRRESAMRGFSENGSEPTPRQPDEDAHRTDQQERLSQALEGLSPGHCEALLLCYAEGLTTGEAAAFLGVGAAAMRKRLERARTALRKLLAKDEEADLLWGNVALMGFLGGERPTGGEVSLPGRHALSLTDSVVEGIPWQQAPWLGQPQAPPAAPFRPAFGGLILNTPALAVAALCIAALAAFIAHDQGWLISAPEAANVDSGGSAEVAGSASAASPMDTQAGSPSPSAPAVLTEGKTGMAEAAAPFLESNEDMEAWAFELKGIVRDDQGNPIVGARVQSAAWLYGPVVEETTTGSAGRFSLRFMPPSDMLFFSAPHYQTVFFRWGATRVFGAGIDVQISMPPAPEVQGTVFDPQGQPLSNAVLYGFHHTYWEKLARSDSRGRFFTELTARECCFWHPVYGGLSEQLWNPAEQVRYVPSEYRFPKPSMVPIRVVERTDSGIEPIAGAQVYAAIPQPAPVLESESARTGADGFATLRYSIQGDKHEWSREGITIPLVATTPDGRIGVAEMDPFGGTLTIEVLSKSAMEASRPRLRVTDSQGIPLPLASVHALSSRGTALCRKIDLDTEASAPVPVLGRFDLLRGYAVRKGQLLYGLKRFHGEAPGDEPLDLVLEPLEQIAFTMTESSGQPVPSAYVYMPGLNGPPNSNRRIRLTTPSGGFTVARLKGETEGRVFAEDVRTHRVAETEMPPGTTQLDLTFEFGGGAIMGRVVDTEGVGVAGVLVQIEAVAAADLGSREQIVSRCAKTNSEGEFLVEGLQLGAAYRLTIIPSVREEVLLPGAHAPVTAASPPAFVELNVRVLDVPVTGLVVAEDGSPVAGATVTAEMAGGVRREARSHKDGRFGFWLSAGKATLRAESGIGRLGEAVTVSIPTEDVVLPIPADAAEAHAAVKAPKTPEASRTQSLLKEMGLFFKLFASKHKDRYPALSKTSGNLSPIRDELFSVGQGVSPAALQLVQGRGTSPMVYTGYAMNTEEQGLRFVEEYRRRGPEGMGGMISGESPMDPALPPLAEGAERFFITDINNPASSSNIQSTVPVMWELPGAREESGGYVLFMDGHVEWVPYPGKFPMTPTFVQEMRGLQGGR